MTAPKDDFPMPARAKVEAALATIDDDRTTADWNEIEEAARWALHVNDRVLMKCGCVAHAVCTARGGVQIDPPIPACIVHECYEVAQTTPCLDGRTAECAYRPKGHAIKPSSYDLPFFVYRGPGSPEAEDKCKCGYARNTHYPRWQARIKVIRRWFKHERSEDVVTREGHCRNEDVAKLWAEGETHFFRRQTHDKNTEVFSADVMEVKQIKSPMKCKTFTPHGPHEHDKFYCGCHGWD